MRARYRRVAKSCAVQQIPCIFNQSELWLVMWQFLTDHPLLRDRPLSAFSNARERTAGAFVAKEIENEGKREKDKAYLENV